MASDQRSWRPRGPTGSPPTSSPGAPPQFFTDHRRGEVNELRQMLKLLQSERPDPLKERETIKKVIAFMTLGIDVSRLFGEMVMACCTTDIVQKKMIYLYISNYAETNPQLALLAVNTLLKDSQDDDPAIRGLALRSLCSLRAPNIVEYIEPALRRALADRSGYVRRTAVMGVLKLWWLNPGMVVGGSRLALNVSDENVIDRSLRVSPDCERDCLLDVFFSMLNDTDTQVVANVIAALNEILALQGGMPFTRRVAASLLNRIRSFNEWGQAAVMNLMSKYKPESEKELYDILNILEERVKHSSPAVVLAVARCFVHLTSENAELFQLTLLRMKTPLLTMIATASPEIAYVVQVHLYALLRAQSQERGAVVETVSIINAIAGDFKFFFCAYADSVPTKRVKLNILALIASESTAQSIVMELAEYVVTETESLVVRKSIEVMGILAGKFGDLVSQVMTQLVSFLDLRLDAISGPALCAIRELLRRSPDLLPLVTDVLERVFPHISDAEALSAALWILGQFPNDILAAPYLLEELLRKVEDGSIERGGDGDKSLGSVGDGVASGLRCLSTPVLIELLNASVKIFLQRPSEIQKTLGQLLKLILSDDGVDFDVRDRALFYYRFLMAARAYGNGPVFSLLRKCCVEESTVKMSYHEESISVNRRHLAQELNTLALVFNNMSYKVPAALHDIDFCGRFVSSHLSDNAFRDTQKLGVKPQATTSSAPSDIAITDHVQTTSFTSVDLLDSDGAQSTRSGQGTSLSARKFEALWAAYSEVSIEACTMTATRSSAEGLKEALQGALVALSITCIASGCPTPDTVKLFGYKFEDGIVLIELTASVVTSELKLTQKKAKGQPRTLLSKILDGVYAAQAERRVDKGDAII